MSTPSSHKFGISSESWGSVEHSVKSTSVGNKTCDSGLEIFKAGINTLTMIVIGELEPQIICNIRIIVLKSLLK